MNAMDTTFTLKDVFYIAALLVSGLTAWFKMQRDKDKMQSELESLNKNLENVIASKATIKFELNKKVDEENLKIHDRITKTQDKHDLLMKDVNVQLSAISIDIAKILGKLESK